MKKRSKFLIEIGFTYILMTVLGEFIPVLNEEFIYFWCLVYAISNIVENKESEE